MFGARLWLTTALLALFVLAPRISQSAADAPSTASAESETSERTSATRAPPVLLDRIAIVDGKATAPLASGGRADLTLDTSLQQSAERLLSIARPLSGAVVAIHARTGRVLAWAHSSRDGGSSRALYEAKSPSASLFKIVTTAALLDSGKVDPAAEVCAAGGTRAIERRHLDPPRTGKIQCGPFGLALGHSRNAVYAQLVTRHLARADLVGMAERFGFNHNVPFDHPIAFGRAHLPYGDLEFARAAAGFTHSTLSPLGAAYLAYVVASSGEAAPLHIVEQAGDYRRPARKASSVIARVMSAWTARKLTRMMEVTISGGTSYEAFTDANGRHLLGDIRVAGKTGTLQPGSDTATTSWFIGFAPSRKPEIVVSVMLANASVYRSKANEVARDVLRSYFHTRARPGVLDPLAATSEPAER